MKDILDGETCELIAAQSVERGFKSEWILTMRYEGHPFEVRAFEEHARMFRAGGLWLPERYQGKRDYEAAPYTVVIGYDEVRNDRRVIGFVNADGLQLKLEDYLKREAKTIDYAVLLEEREREIRALNGQLSALRNQLTSAQLAAKSAAAPASLEGQLKALESLAESIYTAMPTSSIAAQVLFHARYLNGNRPKQKASRHDYALESSLFSEHGDYEETDF